MRLPGLADPVTPVLCLLVIVWVEINVMQDDCVGRGQVDAQATSSRGEQKHEDLLVFVKLVYHLLPLSHGGLPIQPQKPVASDIHVLLYDVQHYHKLREDQHSVSWKTINTEVSEHNFFFFFFRDFIFKKTLRFLPWKILLSLFLILSFSNKVFLKSEHQYLVIYESDCGVKASICLEGNQTHEELVPNTLGTPIKL